MFIYLYGVFRCSEWYMFVLIVANLVVICGWHINVAYCSVVTRDKIISLSNDWCVCVFMRERASYEMMMTRLSPAPRHAPNNTWREKAADKGRKTNELQTSRFKTIVVMFCNNVILSNYTGKSVIFRLKGGGYVVLWCWEPLRAWDAKWYIANYNQMYTV